MGNLTFGRSLRRWQPQRQHPLVGDSELGGVQPRLAEDWQSYTPRTALMASAATEAAEPYLISCIMPAYNERDAITSAVTNLVRAGERLTREFEIIVVDDGSTDGTRQILEQMQVERLRVVGLPENRGYGHALRVGFEAAVHPLVFFTDSDNQFDAADLGRLLPLLADADIVVGYRVDRQDGSIRSLLSSGYNMLVRQLLGLTVRDVNCAFKLMRRDALASLRLTSGGYAINAEILARAQQRGLRIREVGVSHRPRATGRSKVDVTQIPRALVQVMELGYSIRNGNGRHRRDSDLT